MLTLLRLVVSLAASLLLAGVPVNGGAVAADSPCTHASAQAAGGSSGCCGTDAAGAKVCAFACPAGCATGITSGLARPRPEAASVHPGALCDPLLASHASAPDTAPPKSSIA